MKRNKIKGISLAMGALLLFGFLPAASAGEVNLLRGNGAAITASAPGQDGFGLHYLTDGRYDWVGQGFVAKHAAALDTPLPHEFVFDFGRGIVGVSALKIHTFLAESFGIRGFEVHYHAGGAWAVGYVSGRVSWTTYSGDLAEAKSFPLTQIPPCSKIKLVITEKNPDAPYYRMDEAELLGSVTGTAVWTPEAAFNPYFSAPVSSPASLPETAEVLYDSGERGREAVIWEAADLSQGGLYRIRGTLLGYPAIAVSCFAERYSEENSYHDTVGETAKLLKLLTGKVYETGGEFHPRAFFTRLDAARVLFKLLELSPVYETPYQDVGTEDFYYPVIAAAASTGVFEPSGYFWPDAPLETNRLIELLNNALGASVKPVSDLYCTREMAVRLIGEAVYGDTGSKKATNFTDSGRALQNPDMGFVIYFYDNSTRYYDVTAPNHELFEDIPGANTVYLRFPWKHIEPEKGVFNWSFIDTQLQRFSAVGKSVCIGITCAETGVKYATPEWVRNDGAEGVLWTVNGGPTTSENSLWMPYFDDPVFLGHLEDMLFALARKYDASPYVTSLDIRSIGVWGEGHTGNSRITVDEATIRKHLALYEKYFKQTPVLAVDELLRDGIRTDAAQRGFGFRDDSIVGNYVDNKWWHPGYSFMAAPFWKTAPVSLETLHMSEIGKEWTDGADLLQVIEDYHASYLSIHHYARAFSQFNQAFMEKANSRIGYRLFPRSALWSETVLPGGRLSITLRWKNSGTAPFYKDGWPVITLQNGRGDIVARFEQKDFHLKEIMPDEEKTQAIAEHLPAGLEAGTYSIYVEAVRNGCGGAVDLPLPKVNGEKRYYIGDFEVAPPSELLLAEIVTDPRQSAYFVDGTGKIEAALTPAGNEGITADAYLTVHDREGNMLCIRVLRDIPVAGERKISFELSDLYAPGGEVRLYLFSSRSPLRPLGKRKSVLLN